MYTSKITSQGTISIPAALRQKYGLQPGETVTITDNGHISIVKNTDLATIRKENAALLKKHTTYHSGDGFTAHVTGKFKK